MVLTIPRPLMFDVGIREVLGLLGAILTGGLGVEIFKRRSEQQKKREREPIELTARILDEGDIFRQRLLDENARLREGERSALERAHVAELELALAKHERDRLHADVERLARRLERKDEHSKLLTALLSEHGIPSPIQIQKGDHR